MAVIQLERLLRPGDTGHYARTVVNRGATSLHGHDFVELFWIESGRGEQLWPGSSTELCSGCLHLILPGDEHGFAAIPGSRLVIVNLALETPRWRAVVDHWGEGITVLGEPDPRRRRRQLDPAGLRALAAVSRPLEAGRRDRRAVDATVLVALDLLAETTLESAPDWLVAAVERVRRHRAFAGPMALVAACGRSREHVARACRQHFRRTPTELINDLRMAHAAQRLLASDDPIPLVAAECGLENLGHFYRLFAAAHGDSPGAWRTRQQALFGRG